MLRNHVEVDWVFSHRFAWGFLSSLTILIRPVRAFPDHLAMVVSTIVVA
jgi:hypothetical protein